MTKNKCYMQTVSCEIKFAHAHVRARSHVCDVRAKRLSKCACDVRACGHFSCVQRAIAISHVFWVKRPILDFFGYKRLISMLFFHGPTLPWYLMTLKGA